MLEGHPYQEPEVVDSFEVFEAFGADDVGNGSQLLFISIAG